MTLKREHGSWKDRLEYFWMYYKLPFLLILTIGILAGHFIYAKLSQKECILQAMLLDIHTDAREEKIAEEFAVYAGIDTEEYEVTVSASLLLSDPSAGNYAMVSLSKFYSMVGTGELDICMMLEEDFMKYAESGSFLNLREVLSEEELEAFPHLYTDREGKILGVYGEGLGKIEAIGGYEGQKSVAGIIYNSGHTEMAADFLRFLKEN